MTEFSQWIDEQLSPPGEGGPEDFALLRRHFFTLARPVEALTRLSEECVARGRLDLALLARLAALSEEPESASVCEIADELTGPSREADEMIAMLRAMWRVAVRVCKSVDTLEALAEIELCSRNYQAALDEADRAIALDPNEFYGWFRRAEALRALERWDDTITAFRRAGMLRPELDGVRCELAGAIVNRDIIHGVSSALSEAEAILDELVQAAPVDFFALIYRAQAHFLRDEPLPAARCLRRAGRVDPTEPLSLSLQVTFDLEADRPWTDIERMLRVIRSTAERFREQDDASVAARFDDAYEQCLEKAAGKHPEAKRELERRQHSRTAPPPHS